MMPCQGNVHAARPAPGDATIRGGGQASGWKRAWWRQYFPALLVLLLGIGISVAAFRAVRNAEWQSVQRDFDHAASDRAAVITKAIDDNWLALESTRSYYAADHEGVRRDEFHTFVQPFFSHMVGLQALEWAPCVPDSRRAEFEDAVRREGFQDFEITEQDPRGRLVRAARRDRYFPVCYVEPFGKNERLLGYDLASDSRRRAALERARQLHTIIATTPLNPVQAADRRFVFLVVLPVYGSREPTTTGIQPAPQFRGFVLGVFHPDTMIEDALKPLKPIGIDVDVCHSPVPSSRYLAYHHRSRTLRGPDTAASAEEIDRPQGIFSVASLAVGQQPWSLLMKPTPEFIAGRTTWRPWHVLGGGIIFTMLLAAYILAITDQTEQIARLVKERTARLQESEQRLHKMADSAHDAIIMIDPAGCVSFWNAAATRMFGYAAAEMLGQDAHAMLVPPRYRDQYARRLSHFRATGMTSVFGQTMELEGLRRDGTEFPLELSLSAVPIDGQPHAIAVVRDISERRATEKALREKEEKLRTLTANIPGAVYQFFARPNGEMGLYYVDGRFRELFGMVGVTDQLLERFIDGVHPQDRQRFLDSVETVVKEPGPWDFEGRFVTPSGETFWFRAESTPIQRENEVVFNGMLINITDRKRAEEELRGYAAALESANKALEKANRVAESATRVKSEFLANMSHEIRTPMTAILGFADILRDNVYDPICIEAVETVQRNGHYLLDIINNILDLSKIEAGRLQLETRACSPVGIVADVASLMRVRAETAGLTLATEFSGPIPETIQTDPTRLQQILINLVGNAIKFTETGGVRIVTRLCREPGPTPLLQIDVIDTGIGMSGEETVRLFQPFTQADTSTSRRFGGTGLGLTISKRLAEILGGTLRVESLPGVGTTFTMTIDAGPLDDAHMLDNPTEAVVQDKPSQKCCGQHMPTLNHHVLLVEDGPDNQRLIAFLLEKAGARVTVVENGQAAIEKIVAVAGSVDGTQKRLFEPFDVVLMDMQMPVLDGYEATRQLRALGYTSPIVALTANAMSQDRQQCLDAGCDDYLAKPIKQRTLLEMVARYPSRSVTSGHAQPSAASVSGNSTE